MKKIVTLITVCIIFLNLCACGNEPLLVGTTPRQNSPQENSLHRNNNVFVLGDVVKLDNVTVSFVDVVSSLGSDYNKPRDGNIFVLCEFEIANNSNEELVVSSMLSFEAYCDDYVCTYSLQALMEKGDKNQLDGTVAAGKKIRGIVGYELPSDWKELEIHYTSDLLHDNTIVFVATNGQGSI